MKTYTDISNQCMNCNNDDKQQNIQIDSELVTKQATKVTEKLF